MESKFKVTDIPDESNFYDLVSGDNILEIPLFQRPYMWGKKQYDILINDIDYGIDDPSSAVFLGVIVSYLRSGGPGKPPTWMIVDGQQRITTLYISVMAAVYVAAKNEDLDWASDIIGRYLIVRKMSGLVYNTKLVPSYNDRCQFLKLWQKISSLKGLSTHPIYISNVPHPPAPSGPEVGAMTKQFDVAVRVMSEQYNDGKLEGLNNYIDILANKLSVVSISLREPTVAPKIFERLNSGSEPITVADLVRNEIFSRSADDALSANQVFHNSWEPFVDRFKTYNLDFNKFLFPYGLVRNPNVKRNELFTNIRSKWDEIGSPSFIIDDLSRFQKIYLSLMVNSADVYSKDVDLIVDRLRRLNCPSSIFSFLFALLDNFNVGAVSEAQVCSILNVIESFLVRRAICGIEPSGLHAAFKGLWRDCLDESSGNIEMMDGALVKNVLSNRATVVWPSNDIFVTNIINGPLYRRKIKEYAIREYEISLDQECPSDAFQVEHIAPQTGGADWAICNDEEYEKIKNTWGNLVPISGEMNPGASNHPFSKKREIYSNSKFASVRNVAKHDLWDVGSILDRSQLISEWAINRWPY